MKDFATQLGKRLREVRELLGITQAEVARRSGFKACAISNYERGRSVPTAKTLYELCVALDCSANFLLGLRY